VRVKARHTFKAPAFPLYAKEFLQDEAVIAMELETVGAYIILLCHQWNEGSIPADLTLIARICRTTPERMQRIWPEVALKFKALRGDACRLVNRKLEIVRKEKLRFSHKQADSGARGAQKRWTDKARESNGLNGVAHESVIGSRWADDSSGSGSGSVITPPTPSDGEVCDLQSDLDDLPFGTLLDPLPSEVNDEHHSADEKGNGHPRRTPQAVQLVAQRIYSRHPRIRRDISIAQVAKKLVAILRQQHIPRREQAAFLERIDRNHAGMCETDDWQKDGGKYAKGLENWLAPTKERYLCEPPAPDPGPDQPPRIVL
jgi:uncharacterized protein YdaU (DUF1376 family)